MVFELLKRAIEQNNMFMTKDFIRLQVEFFYVAGKLTEAEYSELAGMLEPETVEEPEAE